MKTRKIKIKTTEELVYRKSVDVTIDVDVSFVQLYVTAAKMMIKIAPTCANALAYFCMIEMNDTNYIDFTNNTKLKFDEFVNEEGLSYSNETKKKAIKHLKDIEFLIPVERGRYRINIFGVWKGRTKDRLDEIKTIAYQNSDAYVKLQEYLKLGNNDFKYIDE